MPDVQEGLRVPPPAGHRRPRPAGGGEMLACLLRPGNAGSNTAADHKSVIGQSLRQVGVGSRPGKKVLIRIDGAGSTKKTLQDLAKRRVSYSIGYTLPATTPTLAGTAALCSKLVMTITR